MSRSAQVVPSQPASAGSKTGRVWEIADRLSARLGRRADRKSVIDAYVAEGGNANTGATQFSYWKKAYDAREVALRPNLGSIEPTRLAVARDGRLLIPAEMRAAMLLDGEGAVTAAVVDGELRILSTRAAVHRIRERLAPLRKEGVSAVDEFLADKRSEVTKEDAATAAWLNTRMARSGSAE